MTAYAHTVAAFEMRAVDQAGSVSASGRHMMLAPTEDGWSLLDENGVVVFRGLGGGSRRECLARARELGALSVRA